MEYLELTALRKNEILWRFVLSNCITIQQHTSEIPQMAAREGRVYTDLTTTLWKDVSKRSSAQVAQQWK